MVMMFTPTESFSPGSGAVIRDLTATRLTDSSRP